MKQNQTRLAQLGLVSKEEEEEAQVTIELDDSNSTVRNTNGKARGGDCNNCTASESDERKE